MTAVDGGLGEDWRFGRGLRVVWMIDKDLDVLKEV
jgi:hypothetical protein